MEVARFDLGLTRTTARQRLGWADSFTVVYAGTVGLAQGVGGLLEAARFVDRRVIIRIVGEGLEQPRLEERAHAMHLTNVVFHPAVPRTDVPLFSRRQTRDW